MLWAFRFNLKSQQNLHFKNSFPSFLMFFCKMIWHGLSSIKYWLYSIFCNYFYQSIYMKYLISEAWVWVECCGLIAILIKCVRQGCQISYENVTKMFQGTKSTLDLKEEWEFCPTFCWHWNLRLSSLWKIPFKMLFLEFVVELVLPELKIFTLM